MSSCKTFRVKIGPLLDGELSPSDAELARLHVEACPDCREERRQLERLQASLHSMLTRSPQPAFGSVWQGIEQRISRKRSWYSELGDWTRATFTASRLTWAVPVSLVVALAALSAERFWPDRRPLTPRDNFAAVESIDSHGRNVALLREYETSTTVIWLYQNQEDENEASAETPEAQPSF